MTYWTYTYQHSGPEYYDTEMDREFLLDLREVRSLLDKEKEIKQLVFVSFNLYIQLNLIPFFAFYSTAWC